MAYVVFTARPFDKLNISFDRPPFALGAYAAVAVRSCVFSVVDISAAKQGIVLSVCYNRLAK